MTLYTAAITYLLYLHFIAYAAIYAAKKSGTLQQLPLPAKGAAIVILACAVILDALFNMTVGTVMFLEIPTPYVATVTIFKLRIPYIGWHPLMFTTRCEMHMNEEGWRGDLARWCCKWMNPIQTKHCH